MYYCKQNKLTFFHLAWIKGRNISFSGHSGKQCKNALSINLPHEDNQLFENRWYRINCPSVFNCSAWCQFFASRFNDTKLAGPCSNKFRRLLSEFQISASRRNDSFVTKILLRRCGPFWERVFIFKISNRSRNAQTNGK